MVRGDILGILTGMLVILTGCTPSEKSQTVNDLRSDMALRSVEYFMSHDAEATEVRAVCERWKGSQRPIGSWPSVVISNCTNVGLAAAGKLKKSEDEKLRRQMGI